jgi:hypothetical protein
MPPVAERFFSTVQNDTASDVSGSRVLTQEATSLMPILYNCQTCALSLL